MEQHLKNNCLINTKSGNLSSVMTANRILLNNGSEESVDYQRDILSRMHGDAITKIVNDDEVFNNFGANLYEKLRKAGFPQSTSACG